MGNSQEAGQPGLVEFYFRFGPFPVGDVEKEETGYLELRDEMDMSRKNCSLNFHLPIELPFPSFNGRLEHLFQVGGQEIFLVLKAELPGSLQGGGVGESDVAGVVHFDYGVGGQLGERRQAGDFLTRPLPLGDVPGHAENQAALPQVNDPGMDLHRHYRPVFPDMGRFIGDFAQGVQVPEDLFPGSGIIRGDEGPNIFSPQFFSLITPVYGRPLRSGR